MSTALFSTSIVDETVIWLTCGCPCVSTRGGGGVVGREDRDTSERGNVGAFA